MTRTRRHKNANKTHLDPKNPNSEIARRRVEANGPQAEGYHIVGDNNLDTVTNEPEGFGRGWFGARDVDGPKGIGKKRVKKGKA